ncbi:1-phosphofructokinase family hexose kinase [Phytoactinopolyspora mesophila]|uniref:1-phosphofructokinase n=1 Tax=Phytoactinopolyspora mesophila TaxID=2650750 RepID=A0A7K3M7Y7_9ACTN|nr:1-phosphofructokinase family hexose kinase [Phytoactinopolyspora mesophila]NDL59433.1 1-phosphofructokinase [Phytoactinopolyspora mesophila]
MIVTVTPNPSVDRSIGVRRVERGRVHHGRSTQIDPGGKGVNVARALTVNGAKAVATVPFGGAEGRLLIELLEECGVEVEAVPITGPIRANITITEPDGTTTKFNEPGPVLTAGERTGLLAGVAATLARSPAWLVGCGSLPGGISPDFHARLVELGHRHGVPVAIDTSGPALLHAARAGADLMKPNVHELSEIDGRQLRTLGDVVDAARRLLALGDRAVPPPSRGGDGAPGPARTVVVSLGRYGAVLVRAGRPPVHASAGLAAAARSTVGAGDALLAGYLCAVTGSVDGSGAAALETAVAWGTAAVTLPGSRMPAAEDIAGVQVRVDTDPDPSYPVSE